MKDKLTDRSPLHTQLREVIRAKIDEGEYPPGTCIPSESQLSEAYGLNRLSVRSALAAAGVDYTYRSKDLASPTIGDARGRHGTLGMNQEARVEYKLHVRQKDLEWARAVIRGV